MGLVMGLGEGTARSVLRHFHLVTAAEDGSTAPQFIWISALSGSALLATAALGFAALESVLPRKWWSRVAIALFAFFLFFDWVGISGWIPENAAAMLALGIAVTFARWYCNHETAVMRFWRRSLPLVLALGVGSFAVIQTWTYATERFAIAKLPPPTAAGPRNVVVIVVDTLRSDHLSSYGYSRVTSPNIDRLAREGVVFENAFSASSWTFPSHASMLTGRYPREHGAETGLRALDDRFPTVAEAFEAHGRRTAAFSANRAFFTRRLGLGRGFIHFEDIFSSLADAVARTTYGRLGLTHVVRRLGFEDELGRKRATEVSSAALKWIDTAGPQRPFFVFLNYFDVHDPYTPPEPFLDRFTKPGYRGGIINEFVGRYAPHLTPAQLQGEIDAYDGAIAYVDASIGDLIAGLNSRGLLDQTLVVITSDHGESFGEHGLFLHRNALYRATLQVPLIFYWRGHIPGGVRIAQPVSNAALAATLGGFLDQNQSKFPGPSLSRLWEGSTQEKWPLPAAELAHLPFEFVNSPCRYGRMESLLDSHWHYIVHEKYGAELYEWKQDPVETKNLAPTYAGKLVTNHFGDLLQQTLPRGEAGAGTVGEAEGRAAPLVP